jgi:ubiquinone/menaquinone biosynthesis C-methylase UbiE
MSVDYDSIAARYDARYERNDCSGVERALAAFMDTRAVGLRVLEVGCGTGHWLRFLDGAGIAAVGVDPSRGMLNVARTRLPHGRLIGARAEALPCRTAMFTRLFCVNALHHFAAPAAFFHEAKRVLAEGGGLMTVGLDPHTGRDRWWIYDYFPSALIADRRRYLPAATIRELMKAAGFSHCETRELQHFPAQMSVSQASRRGFLDRSSTSQFMVIPESEYDAGMSTIRSGDAERTVLRSDLWVYGTIGWAT